MATNPQVRALDCGTSHPSIPDQRVGAFTGVPALIRSFGGDPVRVLHAAGLDGDALDSADQRIPYASLGRLLGIAARETLCPHFGLASGQAWQLRDIGLAGEIARNCETVGDALRALVLYQRLNSGGGVAFVIDHEASADFGYAIYHPGIENGDQIYAAVLAGGVNMLRELCGGVSPVETVLVPHAKPEWNEAYRRVFRCPVRFDADRAAIRFRSEWLARPVPGASPVRRRELEREAQRLGPGDFVDRVVRSLRTLLIVGRHSGDDVAQMLALHRRTLNRRLRAHGTSFQEVLDAVRYEAARQLLANAEIPMDEIAMTLGYSGLSAFQRTFRRWSGMTPGRWRRDAHAMGPAASSERAPAVDAQLPEPSARVVRH